MLLCMVMTYIIHILSMCMGIANKFHVHQGTYMERLWISLLFISLAIGMLNPSTTANLREVERPIVH